MSINRRDVLAAGVALLSTTALAPLNTFTYSYHDIQLVVPFSPSGATYVFGRLWAEKMKPFLFTLVTKNQGSSGDVTIAS